MADTCRTAEGKAAAEDAPCLSRRSFIATSALAGGVVVLAAIPIVSTVVLPALRTGVGKWVDFGRADQLPPADFSMLSYEFMVKDGWQDLPQRGFVWARADDKGGVQVFSSTCSHLACNVIWNKEKGLFLCPCHSGMFDANGLPAGGPPRKPLTLLPHKIVEGKLMVHITL